MTESNDSVILCAHNLRKMPEEKIEPCWVLGAPREDSSLVEATFVDPSRTTLGPIVMLNEDALPGERNKRGKLINRLLSSVYPKK